jgi:hypothetical protein
VTALSADFEGGGRISATPQHDHHLRLSRLFADKFDEGPQLRRHIAGAGIVEAQPGVGWQPILQDPLQSTAGEVVGGGEVKE